MGIDRDGLDRWLLRTDMATRAGKLFNEIAKELGVAEAQRIFATYCVPMTKSERKDLKNAELLGLYDTMLSDDWKTPAGNVQQLAARLAKANEERPQEDRYGPRGSTVANVLEKQIRRLIKERKAKQRAYRARKTAKSSRSA
jgi:hypothetical protein